MNIIIESCPYEIINSVLCSFAVDPTCDSELLLHVPYTVNFDDVTCHKAKGYSYGEGAVQIVYDADRDQNVAEFDGDARIEVRLCILITYIAARNCILTNAIHVHACVNRCDIS